LVSGEGCVTRPVLSPRWPAATRAQTWRTAESLAEGLLKDIEYGGVDIETGDIGDREQAEEGQPVSE
jgi:hypothetical protein